MVALHKKGNKNEPSNYRPVSLTSIVCKIMESIIIRDIIMEHFLATDYFSNKQYGFIRGRSTALQLLRILDDWTFHLDLGNQIDVIYTDFEKAFDKIPQNGLLYKLQASGLNNNLISWIQDFLNNRKQFVTVNGQFSKLFKVLSGIPQGSVLGPILFLIYINDLPDFCLGKHDANCDIYLYADDAKLYKTITNGEDQDILQRVINRLKEWCDRWLVSININKCSQMSSKA